MSDVTTFTILNNKFCAVRIGKNWPTSSGKTLMSIQRSQFFWSSFCPLDVTFTSYLHHKSMSDVTTFTILNNKFCAVQIGKNWPTSSGKTLTSLQRSQSFWSLFLSFMHLAPCHPLVKMTLLLPQPEALRRLFLLPTGQTWLQQLLKPLMAPLPEAKPPSFLCGNKGHLCSFTVDVIIYPFKIIWFL
jgi:hypothetical protein